MSKELPEGWVEARVGDISEDISYGFTAKASTSPIGPKMLRITDIQNGSVQWESVPHCALPKNASSYVLRRGDIVFARTGATTGKSFLITACPEAIFASYLIRVRPSSPILPEFVARFFQSHLYWGQISEKIAGSAQPNCNASKLAALRLPVAPLDEQRRIVAKLEELLNKVEACQERLARIPILLRRFRQSVLAAACSGHLTADFRKDEAGQDHDDLPSSWKTCSLKDLCDLITKGASPRWQGINYSTHGVLFVTSENVGWGRVLLDNRKYVERRINDVQPRSMLRKGDLLTNIVGASIGRAALFDLDEPANINQAVALIRLKDGIDRRYVLHVLNSPSLIDHMNSEKVDVARANLSLKDVSEFPIPVPPLTEQREIVRRVGALDAMADEIARRLAATQGHVGQLGPSLLAKAFRGELVPTEAELARRERRSFEPASVLLERVRAERVSGAPRGTPKPRVPRVRQTGKGGRRAGARE